MKQLPDSLSYIKGIGDRRAEVLKQSGINTPFDLLHYFPYKYLDRSAIVSCEDTYKMVEAGYDGEVTIIGKVIDKKVIRSKQKYFLTATLKDDTGVMQCLWFSGVHYFKNKFNPGEVYAVSGRPKISQTRMLSITHPDYDLFSDEESHQYNTGAIIPVYRITEQMKDANLGSNMIRKLINGIFENYAIIDEDILPPELIIKHNLLPKKDTLRQMHIPESLQKLERAKKRLVYEELFFIQMIVVMRREHRQKHERGIAFHADTIHIREWIRMLPFELTSAQKNVVGEIIRDMQSVVPMNRLLQGDVGSGKTVVALCAMLVAVESGYQCVLMAPTEVLAQQHANSIVRLLRTSDRYATLENSIVLVTGSATRNARKAQLEAIAREEAKIIIGTHALFEEQVMIPKLGFVVIDEQHRFGVEQRDALVQKGVFPDVLVMSATPIPRTLSMTVYGDLDVSIINEMPAERKPVQTLLYGESSLPQIYLRISQRAAEGHQAFIVFPLREESELMDLQSANEQYELLSAGIFCNNRIGLITGKMSWSEKEAVMKRFLQKEIEILCATTVIEVGVDVPNATFMVIIDAQRFGLAQLHQLRGRIGRGDKQSYCILVTKDSIAEQAQKILAEKTGNKIRLHNENEETLTAAKRLHIMMQHTNGFIVAEMDMQLRGPGEFYGRKQSGIPALKYANIVDDHDILIAARIDAQECALKDEESLKPLQDYLKRHFSDYVRFITIA